MRWAYLFNVRRVVASLTYYEQQFRRRHRERNSGTAAWSLIVAGMIQLDLTTCRTF